ncbi:MAG: hypothetical protein OEO21_04025 [Candidatus Krumholzibacteria bacterium]|nr:hypothetical protein [Candidatus Krumholzibacteria bacterium]
MKPLSAPAYERMARVTAWLLLALAAVVFLKNAWVCDDAYISYRSIEQVFAGNGPRWNPHERVQVYTSPLWFWTLCLFRVFSPSVFLNGIAAAAIAFAATLLVLRRALRDDLAWMAASALLLASNGFFDFTTSGLESPLCYLVIALFVGALIALERDDDEAARRRALRRMLFAAGALLVCRYDLVTLGAPPLAYAVYRHRLLYAPRRWAALALGALAPFVIWCAFALVYYGTIFPNPAYSKLATGIPQADLWRQGLRYLGANAARDTITVVAIALSMAALITSRRGWARALAAGVALHVAYVVHVGGDFMLGRFLAFPFFAGVIGALALCASLPGRARAAVPAGIATVCLVYWLAYPHTPVNSPLGHVTGDTPPSGVNDERGAYSKATVWYYFTHRDEPPFPGHGWSREGLWLAESDVCCGMEWSVGFYGYWAGTEKRIVDLFTICDPLLARLKVTPGEEWRIGHFKRHAPDGYFESVHHLENRIVDPDQRRYYEKLVLITQSERLFSRERLGAIVAMNLGRYDHYLE